MSGKGKERRVLHTPFLSSPLLFWGKSSSEARVKGWDVEVVTSRHKVRHVAISKPCDIPFAAPCFLVIMSATVFGEAYVEKELVCGVWLTGFCFDLKVERSWGWRVEWKNGGMNGVGDGCVHIIIVHPSVGNGNAVLG